MEIVVRASVMFLLIWALTRGLRRRALADMSPFEMILLVVIGDIVQQGITQEDYSVTGAVLVMAVAWRIRNRMGTPIFAERFSLPDRNDLDRRLIVGSILFGIGWGIAGLCPGPAVASLALSPLSVLPFVLAMLAGMAAQQFISLTPRRRQTVPE